MRLDHLLSKELISTRPHIVGTPTGSTERSSFGRVWLVLVAEARPRPYVSGVVAHGWNIDEESPCPGWLLVRQVRLLRGAVTGWNAVYRVVGVRQAHCWVLRQPAGLLLMRVVSEWVC